jgi:hypothetical protein
MHPKFVIFASFILPSFLMVLAAGLAVNKFLSVLLVLNFVTSYLVGMDWEDVKKRNKILSKALYTLSK